MDEGFVVVGAGFVVADEPAVFDDPPEGAFHDPAAVEELESAGIVGTFDNLDHEVELGLAPGDEPAGVSVVCPDVPDRGEALAERGDDPERAVTVLERCDGHDHGEQKPVAVDGDVPFAAVGFLSASYPQVARWTRSAPGPIASR
ncbi:hypothetical protein Pth03_63810 [Planotetraspora thailandica]|uniref:Uncharacterized protein n=1 Tax=Planotetraspora thailandica TaxID=487172 RepID=A0A8J3V5Z3_9ACTN|nr:hypothetical protein [Planotetraspora thailandica]GII57992.1 hypothetical protein Pth03_63810 [Planotetraspora thailandica]